MITVGDTGACSVKGMKYAGAVPYEARIRPIALDREAEMRPYVNRLHSSIRALPLVPHSR